MRQASFAGAQPGGHSGLGVKGNGLKIREDLDVIEAMENRNREQGQKADQANSCGWNQQYGDYDQIVPKPGTQNEGLAARLAVVGLPGLPDEFLEWGECALTTRGTV